LFYSLTERSFSEKVGLDDGLNRIQPMLVAKASRTY